MVISGTQMILDLTAPFPKSLSIKNQANLTVGDLLIIPSFYLIILKRVLREHFSQEEKKTDTEHVIPDREALP